LLNTADTARENPEVAQKSTFSVLAIFFIVAVLPLIFTPIIPTIDFYNHIGRFFILANLNEFPLMKEDYKASWSMLPNIGLDAVGFVVLRWINPLIAAKLISILMFLSQYFGILFFSRQLTGRYHWITGILAIPLLYSYIFIWGFANFLFGLGLAFFGAGTWLALRRRLILAALVGSIFAVVIFLAHGVAFALYGLMIGGLELGFFLQAHERRVRQAAKTIVALAVQAVAPAALFLHSATMTAAGGVTSADESVRRYSQGAALWVRLQEIALYRLQTIVRVAEGPTLWFDAATFVLTLAVLLALLVQGRCSVPRVVRPVWVIGVLLIIVVPPALFGVGYVSDRMPLFFALLVVGSLQWRLRGDAFEKTALAFLVGLTVFRLSWIGLDWRPYAKDFADFEAVAQELPPFQVVGYVNVSLSHRVGPQRRCEMYGPLLVSLYNQASPLFASATAQPLRQIGRLGQAARDMPKIERLEGSAAAAVYSETLQVDANRAKYDYVLVCDADKLMEPIDRRLTVAARRGRFTLLHVAPARLSGL
jgi:hypothetical protein